MKTLLIIRHAKSSWDLEELHDIERPLAERGKKDAAVMGSVLKKKKLHPQLIMSSPALRAFSTARIICDEIGFEKNKIVISNELYNGNADIILHTLRSIGAGPETVFIVGHNPAFTHLSNELCLDFKEELPTCGMVTLHFPVNNWALLEPGEGKLESFDFPKKFR